MCATCVRKSMRDMLGCDSVKGARWFPKQAVSLTEGLFVKENTGKNLSMSNERTEKEREQGGVGERQTRGGSVTEKVHCRD